MPLSKKYFHIITTGLADCAEDAEEGTLNIINFYPKTKFLVIFLNIFLNTLSQI